jgi:glycerol-3-phosphate acyltransferase PlsY
MTEPLVWPHLAAALLLGYGLGSIPFGVLLTRMAGLGDIRAIGSGNIGATNVLRTGNKGLAAATLVLDGLKGTLAVVVAQRLWGVDPALAAALGAFLGHLYPVWLKFRGGKGVATFLGCLLGFAPAVALAFAILWIAVAFIGRFSSLSALVASAVTPMLLWFSNGRAAALFGLLAALLWVSPRETIARLARGTETRIGKET